MADFVVKKLQTEGFETVYYYSGEQHNETVVLLHGSGPGASGITNWKHALEVMGENYQVIAPDLVGFGDTGIPQNTKMTFWEWTTLRIKQILAILDHHNVEKAHLVGNSMGGIISLNAVMYDESRFDKLILMGSGGGTTNGPTPEIIRMKNFFNDPTIEAFRNLTKWFVYDERTLGDNLEEIVQTRYQNVMREGISALYPTLLPFNPMEALIPPSALRRIKQQVLLVHGYEDQFVPKESSLSLLEHLPNAELVLLKECGHWVQLEKPTKFIQLVDQFIKQHQNTLEKRGG